MRELMDAVVEQAHGRPSKAPPLTFPGELLRLRHPRSVPRWDQLPGWGD